MGVIKIANNNDIIDKSFEDAQREIIKEICDIINNAGQSSEIKKSAQDFLQAYEDLKTATQSQKILEERRTIAQKLRAAKKNKESISELLEEKEKFVRKSEFKDALDEIKTKTQILFQKLENFQRAIGVARQQQFKIFYVFPNKGNPIIVTAPFSKLVSWEYSAIHKKYQGRFRKESATKFIKGLKEIKEAEDLLALKAHQAAVIRMYERQDLNEVYKEVYERYQSEYIEREKRTLKKMKKIVPVFLEKIRFYYINNLGEIGQAYAQFYFSQIRFHDEDSESRIKFFIEEGVLPVNNQSGFLQQDIQFKIGEKIIQGAIKSLDAELMKYQDIVNFAKKIVQQGSVSKQDVASFIFTDAERGTRNAFIHEVEESAIEQIQISKETLEQLKQKSINITIGL